ncbi:MAG: hypothetical protein RIB57_01290 [Pelagibacterium sp.]|jgi:hypothetical protein|uniref:hypothetical protein n=1 Tax=Pelagibacterium sp. TaxID=1967288 RepID=UPI0032EAD303|tara:strand:+ start:332 stop:631 length:300 start_codon:yes stop_codon:yes gene_type:complete
MKNAFTSRLTSLALALSLSLPLGALPVAAQEVCWDNSTIQSALAEGRIQPVAAVLSREGIDPSTEVLSVKVCEQSGALVYVLAVLETSGQARNLTLNAQ